MKNKTRQNSIRVFVRLPNGKRISKVFHRKTDAERFRTEMKMEKYRYEASGISTNPYIKFSDYANEWFEMEVRRRKAEQTQRDYLNDLKHNILPIVANVPLKDINVRHAQIIENKMLELRKHPRTINKAMMVLKIALNSAVKSSYLVKNPIRGYPKLKEPPKTINFWTKEDADSFLEFTKNHFLSDMYVTAINTGMRLGEILGLKWDKIDFQNNQIIISRTLGRSGMKETTKTHEARFIPMNPKVQTVLEKRFKERISDEFVFCKSSGEHLDYHHITQRYFVTAQKALGTVKRIRFHDLRHTFASHFMMNGGNIYTLQKLLGHKDIETTMIYSHLSSAFLQKEIQLVNF